MTTIAVVLEASLRTVVLGLGTWLVLRALYADSVRHRRAAWNAVLLAAILLPPFVAAREWLAQGAATPAASADRPGLAALGGRGWSIPLPSALSSPAPTSSRSGVAGRATSPLPIHGGQRSAVRAGAHRSGAVATLVRCLAIVYGAVALLLLLRLGAHVAVVCALWRSAVPVRLPRYAAGIGAPVRASPRVEIPLVVGDGILLPSHWTTWDRLTLLRVLAHESSHVRRRDFRWLLLARAYQAVCWFNPFSTWLVRELSLLAERQSDEDVVQRHGGPTEYAAMLHAFAAAALRARAPRVVVAIASRHELSARVDAILRSGHAPSARRNARALTMAMVAPVAAMLAAPGVRVGGGGPASSARHAAVAASHASVGRNPAAHLLAPLHPLAPLDARGPRAPGDPLAPLDPLGPFDPLDPFDPPDSFNPLDPLYVHEWIAPSGMASSPSSADASAPVARRDRRPAP